MSYNVAQYVVDWRFVSYKTVKTWRLITTSNKLRYNQMYVLWFIPDQKVLFVYFNVIILLKIVEYSFAKSVPKCYVSSYTCTNSINFYTELVFCSTELVLYRIRSTPYCAQRKNRRDRYLTVQDLKASET